MRVCVCAYVCVVCVCLPVCLPVCLWPTDEMRGISPGYIAAMCVPVSSFALLSRLRSADLVKLSVIRTNTEFGKRAFAHAGPTA